ncbi:unnamed protein product [Paramecium pentaurelia]|uniref:PAS domain-containing protein n=1 Tax=Paramecium pentaurelia TaxID=43138 RepID=A0A8S1TYC7_9CILI|nr:unnamed protein product [Paramecium pentaurelia]
MGDIQGESGQNLIQSESIGFFEKVKQIIFQVLFVLRKDEESEESQLSFYIQTGLDYFQMHTFPFNNNIYYLWKADNVIGFVLNFVNLFQLSTYIPNISYFALLSSVYILLVIILLIILDIIYVSYSFSKNQFAATWPLVVLRSVTSLVVTVLFLPITETLFSILQCQTDPTTGEYIISGYSEIYVVCWQGWHTFHALLTLLFMFMFVAICAIVAYAFFEPGMMSDDRTARQDSKGEVTFIINKVTCQVLYCFLGENQSWILVLATFLMAVWLFWEYNFDDPYYDFEVGRFYSIISSYYLWANILLLMCKIFENQDFNGGFIAWIIGLPFIVSIMLMTKKSKIDTLIKVQKKIRSGKEIWAHIRYVLQLIQQQEKDRNSYMLLIGYIEKHKETCKYNDCYFKFSRRRNTELDMNDMIRGLIQELEKMFKDGIKKFPKSAELKIFYALFIMERKKNKEGAYKQFELIDDKCKPALYQQFIKYRYMKSIKENKKENKDDDIVEAIKYNNHQTMCEKSMQQSAKLQKDFWGELKEDQPDLGKLMKLGADITYVTKTARQNYEEMQKISQNVYQSVKIYSNFILYVLNDQKLGGELRKIAQNIKEEFQKEFGGRNEFLNIDNQPIPFIQVSAKKAEVGKIVNVNTLFTTFFGYQKEELLNKSINVLMPKLYAEKHDNYLIEFFDNIVLNLKLEGEIDSQYLDTDQTQIFKHKNGYVVPFIYHVTLNLETMKYLTTFKSENTIKSQVIFIVDNTSKIMEMSSGAIIFFDLELKQIEKDVYLNNYIPNILLQNEKHIQYNHQSKDGSEQTFYFSCMIKEIKLPQRMDESTHGKVNQKDETNNIKTGKWLVRLEKLEKNEVNLGGQQKKNKNFAVSTRQLITTNTNTNSNPNSQQYLQTSKIQVNQSIDGQIPKFDTNLEFDQQYAVFLSELYSEPRYDDYKMLLNQQVESDVNPVVDYSCDIVIRRLIRNQILNIDEEKEQEFLLQLEEEEEENSIFRFNQNQYEDEDDYKIFAHRNSQDLIRRVLNQDHKHIKITEFKVYSNLWIFFIFFITILQYLFCQSYFISYKESIKSIYLVNNEIIYQNQVISRVLDLCLPQQFNITQLYQELQYAANNATAFNQFVNSALLDYYFDNHFITLRFYDGDQYSEINIKLESALLLIESLALNTTLLSNQTFNYKSNMIQNIVYNHFNVVHQQVIDIAYELYSNVETQMNQYDVNLLITLGILILVTSLAMTKFITLMLSIKMDRENILFLFLDIPQKHISILYKKVEYFIKNYISIEELKRKNELEGYDSSEEEQMQEDQIKIQKNPEEEENFIQLQLKRKKIIEKYRKNKFKGNQAIIIQFIFIALCTLIFAVYNIISSASERDQIRYLLPQYFSGSMDVSEYGNYLNIFKLAILDNQFNLINSTSYQSAFDDIQTFTGNQLSSVDFASALLNQLPTLRDMYFGIYYGDICNELGLTRSDTCYTIIEGNLELGIFNVEQYYLQYFRHQLSINQKGQLAYDPYIYQIDQSMYNYVRKAVDQVQSYQLSMMTNQMDETLNIQLILVIIFILVLLLIFVIYWLPFLTSINSQINQNIQMLNMIPIDVIKDNKTIRRFLKNIIKDMNIQD